MQQEDYIKKQIDQLGRVLGKILSDLLGLKTQGSLSERIGIVDQPLKNSLNFYVEDLLTLPADSFIDALQAENKLINDNLEILADLLFHLADEVDENDNYYEKKRILYQRSLVIYEYLNSTSSTYSFDRHFKVEKIKNSLKDGL